MNEEQLWKMRWFVLTVLALSLLGSIGISVTALLVTKNLVSFSISAPFLLAIHPITRYLFSADKKTTQKDNISTRHNIHDQSI